MLFRLKRIVLGGFEVMLRRRCCLFGVVYSIGCVGRF